MDRRWDWSVDMVPGVVVETGRREDRSRGGEYLRSGLAGPAAASRGGGGGMAGPPRASGCPAGRRGIDDTRERETERR